MLIVHIGMPKTGTTSLQKALALATDDLDQQSILYPRLFRNKEGLGHHALALELAERTDLSGPETIGFLNLLANEGRRLILISSEGFTNLLSARKISLLIEFISRCAEYRSVRLVLACRRVDNFVESMYLHAVKVGEISLPANKYLEPRHAWAANIFSSIDALRHSGILESLALVKYERSAHYHHAMLNALGLSPCEQQVIPVLSSSNERLGAKAQTALLHLDMISEMLGRPIKRGRLISGLESKEFVFDNEIHDYSIFSWHQRLSLHENALSASMKFGLEYTDFFEDDEIKHKMFVELDKSLFGHRDLQAFIEYCSSL